ncbi:MAG: hypothetical protein IT435_04525 [Phycisphaerales bacterium]|nr:hypothetical protein [Phycisphaerales bacterium]
MPALTTTLSQSSRRPLVELLFRVLAGVLGTSSQGEVRTARRETAIQAPSRRAMPESGPHADSILLEIAEAGASPAARIAVAALREMKHDPELADQINACAVRNIKAVRRDYAKRLLAEHSANRQRLDAAGAGEHSYAASKRRLRQALDLLRRECRRQVEFLDARRLAIRR